MKENTLTWLYQEQKKSHIYLLEEKMKEKVA